MRVSSLGRSLLVAGVVLGLQASVAQAQDSREPVFQIPELLGQVERVSVSPPEIVMGGKRFAVAPQVMLTRNGVNEFASFVKIAAELEGQSIAYGTGSSATAQVVIDRILIRGRGSPDGVAASEGEVR